ncbi:RagB/SusD family nutrient uptake outer membrane protein [Thermophagus sp. OGC60D27]|uniref:RagB/SusD family nutrient uptake outer membrane protein n=1 Tax=Thermophagus sp. OGC60D27 TaxID=3458415 RepID=UPI0040380733
MKNINFFLSILGILFLLIPTSCDDFLEVEPDSTWDIDAFYSDETELDLALAGIYSVFASDKVYGGSLITFEAGTDESFYNRRYNDNWTVGLYRYTAADTDIKDFWNELYNAINLCNLMEEKIGNSELSEEIVNRYLAEERFLRAFAYFQLVKWFEDVPMPLTYTKDLSDNNLPVSPMEEVYAQIESDFDFASKYLPHPSDADYLPGRAHKLAAHGMLARVYMKMAGYPLKDTDKYILAKNRCDSVIQDGFCHLTVNSDTLGYRNLFLNYIQNEYNLNESLFEISFRDLSESGIYVYGRLGGVNGLAFNYGGTNVGYPSAYAMMNASPVLPLIYEEGDKRIEWNIPAISYSSSGDAQRVTSHLSRSYCPGKFRKWEPADWADLDRKVEDGMIEPYVVLEATTNPNKNFSNINYPVLRYADILLMYAEADNVINDGPTAQAIAYLNLVRDRAGLQPIEAVKPFVIASKENFFEEIMDERMREFCFEGIRKMDLIRWEKLGERLDFLAQVIKGDSDYDSTNGDHQAYLRASNYFEAPKYLTLPYPEQEVNINNKLEQKALWK